MALESEATKRPSRAGRDLPAALAVGLPLFTGVVLALWLWPPGVVLLLALVVAFGAVEIAQALRRVEMNACLVPAVIGVVAVTLVTYADALWPQSQWLTARWATIGGAVILALVWRMPKGATGYTRDIAANMLILTYVGVLASFVSALIAMPDGNLKLATAFVCVVASDTGGYILGATMGKHPMAPNISPKKTWEGLVGSILLAEIIGILVVVLVLQKSWWFGAVFAMLIVVFGTLGDLVESLIKRDVGIKDMSSILPGHGGVMDRLDSMLLALPVAWLVFSLPL